ERLVAIDEVHDLGDREEAHPDREREARGLPAGPRDPRGVLDEEARVLEDAEEAHVRGDPRREPAPPRALGRASADPPREGVGGGGPARATPPAPPPPPNARKTAEAASRTTSRPRRHTPPEASHAPITTSGQNRKTNDGSWSDIRTRPRP